MASFVIIVLLVFLLSAALASSKSNFRNSSNLNSRVNNSLKTISAPRTGSLPPTQKQTSNQPPLTANKTETTSKYVFEPPDVIVSVLSTATKSIEPLQNKNTPAIFEQNEKQNSPINLPPEIDKSKATAPLATKATIIDNSIIDVTQEAYTIPKEVLEGAPKIEVAPWPLRYIYSYYDIESGTYDQRKFYELFRRNFLAGNYVDLKGNDNYAFVLLFHLFKDYDQHKSLEKLNRDLKILESNYPKTGLYAIRMLEKLTKPSIPNTTTQYTNSYNTYSNDWHLGSKFKDKLKLDKDSVELLNHIYTPQNNFCDIEFCLIELVKLYLLTIPELKNKYTLSGTTLDAEFSKISDLIARKQFNYKTGSANYKYCIDSTKQNLLVIAFKYCENALREHYGHKRKINPESYSNEEVKELLQAKLVSPLNEILASLITNANELDESTEIELNSVNTSRWKIQFEELSENFKGDIKAFVKNVHQLAKLNIKNPSIENIYFEASKFLAKQDIKESLLLYVYYLHYDLASDTFDNKQHTKTVQKNLFKTNEQFLEFQVIVNEFVKDKQLEKAILAASKLYEPKRKKIKLDTTSILEVQEQHSETVELLNNYLQDDSVEQDSVSTTSEPKTEEIQLIISPNSADMSSTLYRDDLNFEEIHISTLEVFVKCNFTVPSIDFANFSKTRGILKNQVIDSLNEKCFDCIDDVLIEEEPEYYTIEPDYYKKLLKQ